MTVLRRVNRPADYFTMVSNTFVRDHRLSLEARGLGLLLLSHVSGWETNIRALSREVGVGRDRLTRILRELESLRYLRRIQERDQRGRLAGMVYELQCTPFPPDDEQETPGHTASLETRTRPTRDRAPGPHKKTASKKTTPHQKNYPSGGNAAAAATPTLETSPRPLEDTVAPSPAQPALFDVPAPEKAGKGKAGPPPGAQQVVAAYVEAHRRHHDGRDPSRSALGRVGRDARALLDQTGARLQDLLAAAAEMGSTVYANLPVALEIHLGASTRRVSQRRGAMGPVGKRGNPEFTAAMADQEQVVRELLEQDPELAAWAARGAVA